MMRGAIVAAAAALAACEPAPPDPARALVFGLDPDSGEYGYYEAELATLTDFNGAAGPVTRVSVDAEITVTDVLFTGGEIDTDEEELRDLIRIRGGEPPLLLYAVENGVAVPEDFHTLAILSYYHGLETVSAWMQDLGVDTAAFEPIATYYRPTFNVLFLVDLPLIVDNAGYMALHNAFLVFQDELVQEVPLALNLGVLAHEYGHAVTHHTLDPGAALTRDVADGWPPEPSNVLRSVDEGLADVYGAAVTGDPDFLAASIGAGVPDRDLSKPRLLTADMMEDARRDDPLYDPYPLGSVIAATIWSHGRGHGDRHAPSLALATTELLRDEAAPETFGLPAFLDALVRADEPAHRADLCALIAERFDMVAAEVEACR